VATVGERADRRTVKNVFRNEDYQGNISNIYRFWFLMRCS
jgi:hypothetical protein